MEQSDGGTTPLQPRSGGLKYGDRRQIWGQTGLSREFPANKDSGLAHGFRAPTQLYAFREAGVGEVSQFQLLDICFPGKRHRAGQYEDPAPTAEVSHLHKGRKGGPPTRASYRLSR